MKKENQPTLLTFEFDAPKAMLFKLSNSFWEHVSPLAKQTVADRAVHDVLSDESAMKALRGRVEEQVVKMASARLVGEIDKVVDRVITEHLESRIVQVANDMNIESMVRECMRDLIKAALRRLDASNKVFAMVSQTTKAELQAMVIERLRGVIAEEAEHVRAEVKKMVSGENRTPGE